MSLPEAETASTINCRDSYDGGEKPFRNIMKVPQSCSCTLHVRNLRTEKALQQTSFRSDRGPAEEQFPGLKSYLFHFTSYGCADLCMTDSASLIFCMCTP